MLRGIAEIATNHPIVELQDQARDKILKDKKSEKKIFDSAKSYKD